MTVSISNMSQVWMSNTNVYNAIAMSVSTLGAGPNTYSSLLKLSTDGNTKFIVTANGYVGIGTNTLNNPLVISVTGNTEFEVTSNGEIGIGNNAISGQPFRIYTNDSTISSTYAGALFENAAVPAGWGGYELSINMAGNTTGFGVETNRGLNLNSSYIWNYFKGAMYFGTDGTERMRIDANGNVGIGTLNPQNKLEINGGITANDFSGFYADTFDSPTVGLSVLSVTSSNSMANAYSSIMFRGTDTTNTERHGAAIGMQKYGTWTGGSGNYPGELVLFTRPANSGNEVERMRIDANGKVGIGTSTPNARLQISSTNNPYLLIGDAYYANSIYDYPVEIFGENTNMSLRYWVNSGGGPDLYFIKSRGTSIGNNAIVLNNDFIGWIAATGSDGTSSYDRDSAVIGFRVDGTPAVGSIPGSITFRTTAVGNKYATERMRIFSNGNIYMANNLFVSNTVITKNVKYTTSTVATLPSASAVGVGAKAFVTDANQRTFYANVFSGGANAVPVFSDGTRWLIG